MCGKLIGKPHKVSPEGFGGNNGSIPRGLPNVYLFINPNSGKPYLTDTLHRLWREATKALSVDIELYQDTRHSVASMATSSGVSIAIINEVLGHTDIRTTQKYSHVDVLAQSQVFAAQKQVSIAKCERVRNQ